MMKICLFCDFEKNADSDISQKGIRKIIPHDIQNDTIFADLGESVIQKRQNDFFLR